MEAILQSILDVAGVSASLVFDGAGRLVAHRGHAVYDQALCEQISLVLVKAVDTVQLQQSDWDSMTAQYSDGKLLLRNLGEANGQSHVLAVIADATLNPSFATVAMRVAANKLKRALAGGSASGLSDTGPGGPPGSSPGAVSPGAGAPPKLSSSGLTWSAAASGALSRVNVADPASGAFLTRCVKELARHVGPMAKVFVEEAARRVSPEAPFSMAASARLVDDLGGQIEDQADRLAFMKALAK
jgi:predicted regulator of Ras-like GTPase activity (Roadblock/LC7/MglB family)